MSDDETLPEGTTESVAEEARSVAVEIYKDGAKTVVAQVGATLGSITRLVMTPLKLLVDSANHAMDRLTKRARRRLEHVPETKLLQPPATIAGPVAMQYALLGDERPDDAVEVLREMLAALLASSINGDTASLVHPAFVAIISQLTPDEAQIFVASSFQHELLELRLADAANPHLYTPHGFATTLAFGRNFGGVTNRLATYVANFERLGLVVVDMDNEVSSPESESNYLLLERYARRDFGEVPAGDTLVLKRGLIRRTAMGDAFLHVCGPTKAKTKIAATQ